MATDKPEKPEQSAADKAAKAEKAAQKKEEHKKRGGGRKDAGAPASKVVSNTTAVAPRFIAKYNDTIVPALTKEFSYTNPNQVPKLDKIVVNMGLGAAVTNPKIVD